MNSKINFFKIPIIICSAIFLMSCGMQGVGIKKGEEWLASKTDNPGMDVSGNWSSPEWGEAIFRQEGNSITGTLGDYPVKGVVSGNGLYLMMMYSGELIHYFAELKAIDKNSFSGFYSKYQIIDEVRNNPSFTRPMKLTRDKIQ